MPTTDEVTDDGPVLPGDAQVSGSQLKNAVGSIVLASVRDLQWRTRRFLLAAAATGLVLGLALMMSGVSNSFSVEIHDTVAVLGADTWLVRAGSPGPFTDPSPFPLSDVAAIAKLPGVRSAAPLMVGRALETATSAPGASTGENGVLTETDVNVLGVAAGRLGSPKVVEGRQLAGPDEIVADESLDVAVGTTIRLNGSTFNVVGLVNGVTYFAGQPVVFMEIGSLDGIDATGLPLASAVLVTGAPKAAVPGFATLDDADVRADLNRPVAPAEETIKLVEVLLWLVAAGIIAAIIYLSAIERRNDFAVLKAVGTPSWHLFLGLVVQAVAMALGAVAIAIGVEAAIAPTSAMAVRLSGADYAAVPILAVVVGIVASVMPARRAATVDPALAFGAGN